ncbi:MAG: pilus assembly protein PilZ [Geobacteraceae bacterium GWC2_55_20]|nr:MAG: pilus assembly protein PilZ [Geobacteraceae bacterium GWC2_55_20]OGU25162.1 MAG: pilus assembly protein PilZ [Geobacteraceae bacterium GWF2_54_21]HCE69522.1 PilZ domain-containing protein [Geobacter sp.]
MSTRKFSRVFFNVEATIRSAERRFQGVVENLSMTGMFLVTGERLAEGEEVEISIVLTGSLPEIKINFSGKVARIVENGMAFVFDKIDLDSYMHLKNIVAYNIDDSDKVMEEICHSIDEKLAQEK